MERELFLETKRRYGTPTYLFHLDELKERAGFIKRCLGPEYGFCFAMKANPFLTQACEIVADRLEVCSPGEYEICRKYEIPYNKIVVSGVNKTEESMRRIVSLSGGEGLYTIESPEHYRILRKIAGEQQRKLDVAVRLSSGSQFGVDAGTFEAVLKDLLEQDDLTFCGIHYYSGTQKRFAKVEKELRLLEEFGAHLRETYGLSKLELEYGPGLPVNYFQSDHKTDEAELLGELRRLLDSMKAFDHITLEMGRFLASDCGYYLTDVADVKQTEGHGYCIVDGGIHQINYYGQLMGMKQPYFELLRDHAGEEMRKWNICGSLCTVNDVIVKDVELPALKKGDTLVFRRCGAYCVTEGMALFLSRQLPQVLLYSEKTGFLKARQQQETWMINS